LSNINIILAAGAQTRWNHDPVPGLPTIKQLIEVKGEILIERIQRQFPDSTVVTKTKAISDHSKMIYSPNLNDVTVITLVSTYDLWKEWTTVLLGDVDYGDSTISLINDQTEKLMFYGNQKEIFAVKFHESMGMAILMTINRLVNDIRWTRQFGKLWNLYRMLIGHDFRLEKIDKYFTFVSDCRDFDTQKSYKRYAEKQKIRRQDTSILP